MSEKMKISELPDEELERLERRELLPGAQSLERVRARFDRRTGRRRYALRLVWVAAALLLLSAGVVTAYQRWGLTKPEEYEGPAIYVEEEQQYPREELPQSEAEWTARAEEMLALVGVTDYDAGTITVREVVDQRYDRRELEVSFKRGESEIAGVTFDGESGALLHISTLETREGDGAYDSYEAASARALEFYQKLPVPQGYELRGGERYDDWYWSFDFCKKVREDIWSYHECVRIGINPMTGDFGLLNVFNTPLLDDHQEGETELTEERADELARAVLAEQAPGRNYQLVKAERGVVKPNYESVYGFAWGPETTGAGSETQEAEVRGYRDSDVTRLAYEMYYENPESEFADSVMIGVDLYTGAILCISMTR